jgi:hypothetical protein
MRPSDLRYDANTLRIVATRVPNMFLFAEPDEYSA